MLCRVVPKGGRLDVSQLVTAQPQALNTNWDNLLRSVRIGVISVPHFAPLAESCPVGELSSASQA